MHSFYFRYYRTRGPSTQCKRVCKADHIPFSATFLSGKVFGPKREALLATFAISDMPQTTSIVAERRRCAVSAEQDQRIPMSIIKLHNLGVTLATTLFSGLNLTVNSGDRIAIVAANLRGKSPLLKCITGACEPSEEEILRACGLTTGMVEQNFQAALAEAMFRDAV